MKTKISIKKILSVLVISILLAFVTFFYLGDILSGMESALLYFRQQMQLFTGLPLLGVCLGLIILPLFCFPVSPLLILAGTRATPNLWVIFLLCSISITINLILSYFLAKVFRRFLSKILEKRGYAMPSISKANEIEYSCILRLMPGSPMSIQNYILAIGNISFKNYCLTSIPLQCIIVYLYVAFGDAILNGKASQVLTILSLIIVFMLMARVVVKKYKMAHKKEDK